MPVPQIIDLANASDLQVRDVYHRNQFQMVPTANVLQRLYHHVGESGPILSAVEAVTLDASSNASWDLMLSKNTADLDANTITTANLSIWSGNAIMSVNPTLAAIRSTNFVVTGNAQLSNLTVSGNVITPRATISNTTYRTFTKTLGSTVNNSSIICDFTSGAAFGFELAVVQSSAGNVFAKYYSGTSSFNSTIGEWKRLIPFSSTGTFNNRDWAVDFKNSGSTGSFRLVRIDTSGTGNTTGLACALKIYNAPSLVVVNESSVTDVDATNTGYYENTLIGQVDNKVGIGTDTPTSFLDVAGNTNISGTLNVTGNASFGNVVGNLRCGNVITNSVTATTASVSGNITALGSSHRVGPTQIISLTRQISGNVVGSGVHLGNLYAQGTASMTTAPFTVTVTVSQQGIIPSGVTANKNEYTKTFIIPYNPAAFPSNSNGTPSPWLRALPSSESFITTDQNEVSLDVAHHVPAAGLGLARLGLALVRTRIGGSTPTTKPDVDGDIHVTFSVATNGPHEVEFFPLTDTYSPPYLSGATPWDGISPTNYYLPTPLAVKYSNVGVFTDNFDSPHNFQVNVRSRMRHGVWVDNGLYGGGIVFGNKWRIAFNPDTDDLEIHKNADASDYDWTNFTATATLAFNEE